MTHPLRLAIFTSHPIQYQAPLFRALAARPGLAPTVFFASRHGLDEALDPDFAATFSWDVPLVEGYDHVFLPNHARRPDVSSFTGARVDLRHRWTRASYDAALVLGWQSFAHLQAMRAARAAGIPLYLRGESHLGMAAAKPRLRSLIWHPLRERIYRRMFAGAAGMLTIGTRNAEYYRHFGVPSTRLHLAPYCVDNARFALDDADRTALRHANRAALGIPDDALVFAAVGKLTGKKRPLDTLAALAKSPSAYLVFVGDGPERPAVSERAAELGVSDRVRITGFVNQQALPGWYAAADALVLASEATETWGLVVNEAMAAGLPVLVSEAAGCAPDLVRDNGWTFPLGDVRALAARMAAFAALPASGRAAMGDRSRAIIADFTVDRVAATVESVLRGTA